MQRQEDPRIGYTSAAKLHFDYSAPLLLLKNHGAEVHQIEAPRAVLNPAR